jgi:hypothetical protein
VFAAFFKVGLAIERRVRLMSRGRLRVGLGEHVKGAQIYRACRQIAASLSGHPSNASRPNLR